MKYRAVRVAGPLIERVEDLSDYIRKDAERDLATAAAATSE